MLYYLSTQNANIIYKYVKQKKLRKVYWWVYTDDMTSKIEEIFKLNIEDILMKSFFVWNWNEFITITKNWQFEKTENEYNIEDLTKNEKNFYISDYSAIFWIFNNSYYIRSNSTFKKNIYWIDIISQKITKKHNWTIEEFWNTYKICLESALLDLCADNNSKRSWIKDINLEQIIRENFDNIRIAKIKEIWEHRKVCYYKFMKIYRKIRDENKVNKIKEKQNLIILNTSKYSQQLQKLSHCISLVKNHFSIEHLKKHEFDVNDKQANNILYVNVFLYFKEFYKQQWIDFSKEDFWLKIKNKEINEYTNMITLERVMFQNKDKFANINDWEQFSKLYMWILKSMRIKKEADVEYLKECYKMIQMKKLNEQEKALIYFCITLFDNVLNEQEKMIIWKILFDLQLYITNWVLIDISSYYNKLNNLWNENTKSLTQISNNLNLFLK